MWERTLQDLIRGLRANKKDEAKFIAKAVDEIRQEIKSEDMELKAGAVMKLTYVCITAVIWSASVLTKPFRQLDMLGYDMSWASFHVVEVMSSAKAHLKSVGYLGAIQSFTEDTDVLMLTTNLLKKVSYFTLRYSCHFMRSLGFEFYAHRYCHHFEWTRSYRHGGPRSRSSTRTHRYAEPFASPYPETGDLSSLPVTLQVS
jgi:hypothetical protein